VFTQMHHALRQNTQERAAEVVARVVESRKGRA
jgi:lipid-A-disaccharide synthase